MDLENAKHYQFRDVFERRLKSATWWCACSLTAGFFSGQIAFANTGTPSDECYFAARIAADKVGVSSQILLALAKTETGRSQNGVVHPWPWAINIRGQGKWYANKVELLEAALAQISVGETSFDVGCFQLNYRWHGDAFSSLDEMISPKANALYAANFLMQLYKEFGDWNEAGGAYHSRTAERATIYKAKFAQHYTGEVTSVEESARTTHPTKERKNSFPLIRSATLKPQLGSLVPSAFSD
jgi:hypothetical protein